MRTGISNLEKVMLDKQMRVEYLKYDLPMFSMYYYPDFHGHDYAKFHLKYMYYLQKGYNIIFEGFRESAKTALLKEYLTYTTAYRTKRNTLWFSYVQDDAKKSIMDISNMLGGYVGSNTVLTSLSDQPRLIEDFGKLYTSQIERYKTKKTPLTMNNFETTNGCSFRALGLGKSPRGTNYVAHDGSFRPDMLVFDDVDTIKSVANPDTIDKNRNWFLGEVLGGAGTDFQVVFLFNTIEEDGLGPRLREHVKNNPKWIYMRVPIVEDGQITWDRFVWTEKEAIEKNKGIKNPLKKFVSIEEKRKILGEISYAQNFELKPYKRGQKIIKDSRIQYDFDIEIGRYRTVMGVDPAYSTKTSSDGLGVAITSFKNVGADIHAYVRKSYELVGDEKEEKISVDRIVADYKLYQVDMIFIEGNNGGEYFANRLREKGCAVSVITRSKDKETTLKEHEYLFSNYRVHFQEGENTDGILQITKFGIVKKDDIMDAILNTFYKMGDIDPNRLLKEYKKIEEHFRPNRSYNIEDKYLNNGNIGPRSAIGGKF